MALAFQSASTKDQGAAGGGSIVINKPTGTAQNDELEAVIQCDASAALTAPTGWTLRKKTTVAGAVGMSTYRLVAGASEPTTYTWSATGGSIFEGCILRYSGENTTAPDDGVAASTDSGTTGTTITSLGITTTTASDFDLAVVGTWSANTLTFNGVGYTADQATFGSNGNLVQVQRKAITSAGATGNQTWTQDVSAQWVAQQYAIKPAAGGGGTTTVNLAGTLTTSGALVKQPQKLLAGTLTTAGAFIKQVNKLVAGTLTTSGALIATRVRIVALAGTLTTSGALVKQPIKVLSGALTTGGSLVKSVTKVLTGTLSSSGALVKQPIKHLAGTLTSSGTTSAVRVRIVALAGTLTTAGVVVKQPTKLLTATLSSSGALVKQPTKLLNGALSASGGIVKTVSKLLGGVLSLAGSIATVLPGAVQRGSISLAVTLPTVALSEAQATVGLSTTSATITLAVQ